MKLSTMASQMSRFSKVRGIGIDQFLGMIKVIAAILFVVF
jgi:hypothetical protein